MAPYRFTPRRVPAGVLTAVTAAVLALAGCHSSSGAASGSTPATGAATAAGSATAASSGAAPTTAAAAGSGSGVVSYFPEQVGDTWTYSENLSGRQVTVSHKITAVTPVADGTEVTMAQTTNASGSAQTNSFSYIVRPDGSITVPLDFSVSSGDTVTSTGSYWPTPAQIASGQPVDETPVTTMTLSGQTTTVTAHAVVKGEGNQSVTVPAGTYTATVIDNVTSEKIEGYTTTFESKTWLANGVGPVKETLTTGSGSDAVTMTEVLTSFTKG